MEEKDIEEEIQLRSDELQEIIGKTPSSIERYGIIVMAVIVLVLMIGSCFFRYPETIDTAINITNYTPSVNIVARTGGNMRMFCVSNSEDIEQNALIGVINNPSCAEDVFLVENYLRSNISDSVNVSDIVLWAERHRGLQLGDIQSYYNAFITTCRKLRDYQLQNYLPTKIKFQKEYHLRQSELDKDEHLIQELGEQQESLIMETYRRDSILFSKNMISREEYEKSERTFLQCKQNAINRKMEDKRHHIRHIEEKESILDLEHQDNVSKNQYEIDVRNAKDMLESSIRQWENTYVLRSPIAGKVSLMGAWSKDQYVNAGELLCVVMPRNIDKPMGKAFMLPTGAGKVRKGQRVLISINNYPEDEFGNIIGIVKTKSSTPTAEGMYIVDIEFPDGLKTIFKKTLPLSQQMSGTARIIVENRRLVDLFVKPVTKLLKTQESLNDEE